MSNLMLITIYCTCRTYNRLQILKQKLSTGDSSSHLQLGQRCWIASLLKKVSHAWSTNLGAIFESPRPKENINQQGKRFTNDCPKKKISNSKGIHVDISGTSWWFRWVSTQRFGGDFFSLAAPTYISTKSEPLLRWSAWPVDSIQKLWIGKQQKLQSMMEYGLKYLNNCAN